jgi:riboflavin kinase / FMN adenylyltransferase
MGMERESPMGQDVVAIGTFDGVHIGHQRVLAAARRRADEVGGRCVAYTFDSPPRTLLGDEDARLLLPPSTKRRLLTAWADRVVEAPFLELRDLGPLDFVRDVLARDLGASAVVVGESFRFGRDRSADVRALADLASESGIGLVVVPPLLVGGAAVSSTRIRDLLALGDVAEARDLLGRPPLVRGDVVAGDAIGRTLGFPTANLLLDPRVLVPGDGVYLSRAYSDGIRSVALTYCGHRPTLGGTATRCEVHLLNAPDRDLRGATFEVHLYAFLRPDRAFPTLEALRERMEADLRQARRDASLYPDASDPDPFGG